MKSAEKRRLLEDNYLNFFSLAMAMLRNADDAKDAVQETIVKVLTTHNIDDVVKYSFKTLRNEAINIIRHRQRMSSLGGDVVDEVSKHEIRLRLVADACDGLPEALRALVELHDVEDYTLAELSALTGLSVSTVRRRLEEAHEMMKKQIEEEI